MLKTILGARLRWFEAPNWIFEPVLFGPDSVEYTVTQGPHAGRHAIQRTYYQRVAPGIETTAWYEENGALVHITWYLEAQTTHRFAAIPAYIQDMAELRGDNQDPAFLERVGNLAAAGPDAPRRIISDDGYFEVL
ncbi:MAG TPA: phenolic acid decarboxylase [Pseudonocardia sp.]|nr:phenolic acid decarboxylase [Pseudonocardia sp.]